METKLLEHLSQWHFGPQKDIKPNHSVSTEIAALLVGQELWLFICLTERFVSLRDSN